jgi:hypothetical protein
MIVMKLYLPGLPPRGLIGKLLGQPPTQPISVSPNSSFTRPASRDSRVLMMISSKNNYREAISK